jgi:hypothetical protein
MDCVDPSILERNLAAIAGMQPALAQKLRETTPAVLEWQASQDGRPSAVWKADQGAVTLASRYTPWAEAERLVGEVDPQKTAAVVLLGLGVGYAAQVAAERVGERGALVVYEPEPGVLRAVLERVDHTDWLSRNTTVLFSGGVERAEIIRELEGWGGLLIQGTKLVTHPVARRLNGEAISVFSRHFTDVLAYCRTNVATALVNSARTCRNQAMNLDVYAAGDTTEPLLGAAKGYPAVCVSAGPSLIKNVKLLADPAVRRNVVVIAVQTALRPLLDHGIEPDFVTALDYSPICAQFYEGLPPLPGVTLVAEPKANAAILDAFPGPVRLAKADFNDKALGGAIPARTPIKSGATVAHLSVYVAEHLGCDPIILIGQDLGFSDGLYYCPGTAVHQVWECELGPFNTIEMMEWQRIARMRGTVKRLEDVHGRPIYSDEQMLTYLKQFERDFAEMTAAGKTILDATEGGLPKKHTTITTLSEALEQHATRPVHKLPEPNTTLDADRLVLAVKMIDRRVREVGELQRLCNESMTLLDDMIAAMSASPVDRKGIDKAFAGIEENRKRVMDELSETFDLVNAVNVIGAFRRNKQDRLIDRSGTTDLDRSMQQAKRDRENLEWLAQACDEACAIFTGALERAEQTLARVKGSAQSPVVVRAKTLSALRKKEVPA